jgi:hypothetical protein
MLHWCFSLGLTSVATDDVERCKSRGLSLRVSSETRLAFSWKTLQLPAAHFNRGLVAFWQELGCLSGLRRPAPGS